MINRDHSLNRFLPAISYFGPFISFAILLINPWLSTAASYSQEREPPPSDLALEVILPNNSQPPIRFAVANGERGMTLVHRQRLTVKDPDAAGDFTAVDIWADSDGISINVRLSIIYNDLSNQEWWKNKKEKILGSFLIQEGGSVRPAELAQFGIVPFEMKAINARPLVFQPGAGLRIINNSKSLEVVRLEKSLDHCRLWLKNNASKGVVAYNLSIGNSRVNVHGRGYGSRHTVIAAGETYREEPEGPNIEPSSITIHDVVFDDGTFEGDAELAARFLVKRDGIRIQAPSVLGMVQQALEVDDAELETAVDRLEAQLAVIREAIDKQSALGFLKSKYPAFEDQTISGLYEDLKSGLYEAKNMVLMPLGNMKRQSQKRGQDETENSAGLKAKLLREMLIQIKDNFEGLSNVR